MTRAAIFAAVLLSLASVADAALTLTWVDPSGGVAATVIFRRAPSGEWGFLDQVPPGVMTFVDTSVAPGETQCYRVQAVTGTDASPLSDTACGTAVAGFALTVHSSGAGMGTVTLTAMPFSGFTFTGWGGACSGTAPCIVGDDAAVTARFSIAPPPPPTGPDLVVIALDNPPSYVHVGRYMAIHVTVKNTGTAPAGASTTRFFLAPSPTRSPADVALAKTFAVGPLAAGQVSNGDIRLVVPLTTPLGVYYLMACADDLGQVAELDEANNCRASTGTVRVVL